MWLNNLICGWVVMLVFVHGPEMCSTRGTTLEGIGFTSIFREVSGHVSAVTFDVQMSHQQHPRNAAWISRRSELGHAHVPA